MNSENKIIIAIDGHSSSGKSTLARDLARKLHYIYIDSGAMYRAVARYLLDNKISVYDLDSVIEALDNIELTVVNQEGRMRMILNGEDVSERIRLPEVTDIVSEVAVISEVRRKLVDIQRRLGEFKGIVMDGRDIGSVVFPNAEMKLFVTASIKTRAQRRLKELQARKLDISMEKVQDNLKHRDHIDSTRDDSPLIQTDDAVFVDNSNLDREQQLELVMNLFLNR